MTIHKNKIVSFILIFFIRVYLLFSIIFKLNTIIYNDNENDDKIFILVFILYLF